MTDVVFVYITVGSRDEARELGELLVERRLAACVNVLPNMTSIYRYEGKIERADECVLIAKTQRVQIEALTQAVKERHSYDCPCIVALPVTLGDEGFLRWVIESTDPQAG